MPATWSAFAVVFCLGTIADHAPQPRFLFDALVNGTLGALDAEAWFRSAWVLAAAWVLVRPRSFDRFALLCAVGIVGILSQLPRVPNHWVVQLGVYAATLATYFAVRVPKERHATMRALLFGAILAVYFWTFVHKLNHGFLDPNTSCGPVFVESLASRLGFHAPGGAMPTVAIVLVLVTEGAMPVLLAFTRTRALGILLGIGLHFVFGLFVAGFSFLMWATYFVLLPDDSLDRARGWLRERAEPFLRRVNRVPNAARAALAFVGIVSVILLIKEVPRLRALTQQETLLLPLSVAIAALLIAGLSEARFVVPIPRPRRNGMLIAVTLTALVFLNGTVPYFGVRNTLAFSMFSNLRTENERSNHLFIPVVTTRFSVLQDQVRILESSDEVLAQYAKPTRRVRWNWTALIEDHAKASFEIPFFVVRLRAEERRDADGSSFSVKLRRNGVVEDLSPSDVDALEPVGWASRWLHWSKGTPLPPNEFACMW